MTDTASNSAGAEALHSGGLRRYARIYAALWRNSVVREMGFKVNFLLWIVVEFVWFLLHLAFIQVLYMHTDSIATWTRWEVVLLMSTSHFIQQLFTAIFLNNCTQLSENVRTGRLDFILLLPASPRFLLSLRHVDLGSFINAASALAVVVYAGRKLGLHPGAGQWMAYGAFCAVGVMVHYALMFLMACVSFWTVRAQGIMWGYYNLFNIARMPDEAFRGGFRRVFTFVLPMLLVSNVPARILVDKLHSPAMAGVLLLLAVACYAVSHAAWTISLRRYTSASS